MDNTNTSANIQAHVTQPSQSPILTKLHAGYFVICISFGAKALLLKNLSEHKKDSQALWYGFNLLPYVAFLLLWYLAVLTATPLSLLYMLKCILDLDMVEKEFSHHIGVNCMYVPWIFLAACASISTRGCSKNFLISSSLFGPFICMDNGSQLRSGSFVSVVANPASQVSVIGNLAAAQVIAEVGCSFDVLGLAHCFILFVTLCQRLTTSNHFPTVLRPAYFLSLAAQSMASLAWKSISGAFVTPSKMMFFLPFLVSGRFLTDSSSRI